MDLPPGPPPPPPPAGFAAPPAMAGGAAGDSELAGTLLREAQEEIASLRSQLYTSRRQEWGIKEALTKASHERDDAVQELEQLRQQAQMLQATATRAVQLKEQFHELERNKSVVDLEVTELRQKLDEAQRALHTEQAAKRKVDELRARAESERSRLQRERDEAQSQLRIVRRRVEEAEEEQCRAEDEAAQARAELAAYASSHQTGQQMAGGDEAAAGGPEETANVLRQELESERSRVASLVAALEKTKAQAIAHREQADVAQENGGLLKEELQQKENDLQRREAEVGRREAMLLQAQAHLQRDQDEVSRLAASKGQTSATDASAPTPATETARQDPTERSSEETAAAPELQRRLEQLEKANLRLQKTQEKLLQEMDEQSSTLDQLYNENVAISSSLMQQRHISSKWELQAQEGLLKAEQLKNMLQESASWHPSGEDAEGQEKEAQRMEGQLLAEQAKVAELDLQVRALTAELTKASQHTGELGRSILPVLSAIEARMVQISQINAEP